MIQVEGWSAEDIMFGHLSYGRKNRWHWILVSDFDLQVIFLILLMTETANYIYYVTNWQ